MLVIHASNVNEALPLGMMHLKTTGVRVPSRVGATIEYPFPVTTRYARPDQCVLFDPERDANPFFHFFEALWILHGAQDVASLSWFLPRIKDFSDNGQTFHGAYGYRLREAFGFDQIEEVIRMLRRDPGTRRAVVSIYHPSHDLNTDSKDIPCNDMVMFSIRQGKLNMTVCNRSNDVIWGAYGANAVQFSFLMQYVAAGVGVGLGAYYQVSNSYHVYEDNPYWQFCKAREGTNFTYPYRDINMTSMKGSMDKPEHIREDLQTLFWAVSKAASGELVGAEHRNTLIEHTAAPMLQAYYFYRAGDYPTAMLSAEQIAAADWRAGCKNWLNRRKFAKGGTQP